MKLANSELTMLNRMLCIKVLKKSLKYECGSLQGEYSNTVFLELFLLSYN